MWFCLLCKICDLAPYLKFSIRKISFSKIDVLLMRNKQTSTISMFFTRFCSNFNWNSLEQSFQDSLIKWLLFAYLQPRKTKKQKKSKFDENYCNTIISEFGFIATTYQLQIHCKNYYIHPLAYWRSSSFWSADPVLFTVAINAQNWLLRKNVHYFYPF